MAFMRLLLTKKSMVLPYICSGWHTQIPEFLDIVNRASTYLCPINPRIQQDAIIRVAVIRAIAVGNYMLDVVRLNTVNVL